MCGITGYVDYSGKKLNLESSLNSAVSELSFRGPDNQNTFLDKRVGLGHTRLSIIDPSSLGNQPMIDPSGRYVLVFNGEIYNYKELQNQVSEELISQSDTEVLLHLLINKGEKCLVELNGFFALAFYDSSTGELLLARDRMGIKPLHFYQGTDFFAFGSEMKALLSYPVPRGINKNSLFWYLNLTYLPMDMSMIPEVRKLLPGHYIKIINSKISINSYEINDRFQESRHQYNESKNQIIELLESSVKRRLVSDVPLGAFLSGGTDSSVIVSIASNLKNDLQTFSIGYKDHPYFDETHYAELVAEKFKTNHTTFSISNDDLLESLSTSIDYIDEPFADSSAIPTFILSKRVSSSMKVALSGDGADELFGGYYKHLAFHNAKQSSLKNFIVAILHKPFKTIPQTRSSRLGNLSRRIIKYSSLLALNPAERYWLLASFNPEAEDYLNYSVDSEKIEEFKNSILSDVNIGLNDFLEADLKMVLPGDMLTKVDLMSMANSLEVRVPFLDKELVSYVKGLPESYKVNGNKRKRILQDAYKFILPNELYNRPKKGFEVPLHSWLRNELWSEINDVLFNHNLLKTQGLFNVQNVLNLRNRLTSRNPGDVHYIIWSLYVFQKWYLKYF